MNLADFKKPFSPNDIEFRAGATNQDKTKALALPYLRSQAVMDRLDEVAGPENWKNEYQAGPGGGVMCILSIRINNEWVPKAGIGENTDFEAIKGGESDALKRAAVRWGIGRYLYLLPNVWVKAEQRGKSVVIDEGEARAKLFGQKPAQAAQGNPPQANRPASNQGQPNQGQPRANGQTPTRQGGR